MSKNIREKIVHTIQTKLRLSPQNKRTESTKSKMISCCSVKKPDYYEYYPYEWKQTPKNNDYIDLSECHSSSLSYSQDSGISSYENGYQLESTKIFPDDSSLHSTINDLSPIPRDQKSFSHGDTVTLNSVSTLSEPCHCQCHHPGNNNLLLHQKRTAYKLYPFIF